MGEGGHPASLVWVWELVGWSKWAGHPLLVEATACKVIGGPGVGVGVEVGWGAVGGRHISCVHKCVWALNFVREVKGRQNHAATRCCITAALQFHSCSLFTQPHAHTVCYVIAYVTLQVAA